MAVTLEDHERRIFGLERAQVENAATLRWVVGTLGQMQAIQDHHTTELRELRNEVGGLDRKLDAMPRVIAEEIAASEARVMQALPQTVVEAVREALSEKS